MKKGWKIVPMGKLCSISSGESDTQDAVEDGPYAFFDRSKTIKRSSRFLYDCEALIIPGEGKEFLPKHFEGKFDLHQRAYALFDFLPELDVRFLYHLLHHRSDYFPSVAVGATVKSLRRRHFEDLPVPVPPLAEQQRIVGLLDEAFEGLATAKANAAKNLQNARALFESHLQSVFTKHGAGWETRTIGDVCEVIAGQSPEGKFYNADGKGTPFYQGKKDFGDKFIEAPTSWTTQTTKLAKAGDILMSVRAPVGPVNFTTGEVCIGRGLAAIRSSAELNRDFLFYQLWHLQPKIAGREGAVFASINKAEIKALPLSFAPLAEQQRIVGILDSLSEDTKRLTRLYEEKLAALEALKKSLLHRAFTGEL